MLRRASPDLTPIPELSRAVGIGLPVVALLAVLDLDAKGQAEVLGDAFAAVVALAAALVTALALFGTLAASPALDRHADALLRVLEYFLEALRVSLGTVLLLVLAKNAIGEVTERSPALGTAVFAAGVVGALWVGFLIWHLVRMLTRATGHTLKT